MARHQHPLFDHRRWVTCRWFSNGGANMFFLLSPPKLPLACLRHSLFQVPKFHKPVLGIAFFRYLNLRYHIFLAPKFHKPVLGTAFLLYLIVRHQSLAANLSTKLLNEITTLPGNHSGEPSAADELHVSTTTASAHHHLHHLIP